MLKKYTNALQFFMNIAGVFFTYSNKRKLRAPYRAVIIKGKFLKSMGYSCLLLILWMLLIAAVFVIEKNITNFSPVLNIFAGIVWSLFLAPVVAVYVMGILFPRFTERLQLQSQADQDDYKLASKK